MNLVQITPGAGESFYCENCVRDTTMLRALRRRGHRISMVPLYLPVLDLNPGRETAPIFFGGINVYLQQKAALFRRTPRFLDRLLDATPLLRWASRRAGMTRPEDLGETMLSMLRGERGRQAKELRRLIAWLEANERPDVVVLSNALLLGLVPALKGRLKTKIVCLLQDEDEFLDLLPEPYQGQALGLLRELARGVDRFVAVSRYYAGEMSRRLDLPAEKMAVIYTGLAPEGFTPAPAPPGPTIGFLSRMYAGKGLDLLAEAFVRLKRDGRRPDLRLRACGGWTGADEPYLAAVKKTFDDNGLLDAADFLPNADLPARQDFYRTLSVLSVPERRGEASGLYVLEALGCGVPVVQPASGVFPELLEATGGGELFEPLSVAHLASALGRMLDDPAAARARGLRARQVVLEQFSADRMAGQLIELYERVCDDANTTGADHGG